MNIATRRYAVTSLLCTVRLVGFAGMFPLDSSRPTQWIAHRIYRIPGCGQDGPHRVSREEVAAILRLNRRANLGRAAREDAKGYGVMRECPRTTLQEWKRPH